MISQGFWQDRKVFILGHTGFRGAHLAQTLHGCGALVSGYALPPKINPSYFELQNIAGHMASALGDVRDADLLQQTMMFHEPEVVISLLGGEGLKDSKQDPRESFEIQIMGTLNLLEGIRKLPSVRACVLLTSDKVYRTPQLAEPIKESDPLGGQAPSATAKACVELISESYLKNFFQPEKYNKHQMALATARMGSVFGPGDFQPESFVWQALQAYFKDQTLSLRNPNSLRSWLPVANAVEGILKLAQALVENGPSASGAWNFGVPAENRLTVAQFLALLQGEEVALTNATSVHGELDDRRAQQELGWKQTQSLQEALDAAKRYAVPFCSAGHNLS